jgi:flagellar hook protein FlgE
VELTPENQSAFSFALKIGEAGTFSGVASTSGTTTSQLSLLKQDGIQLGTLVSTTFDDRGRITLKYSNGETLTPATMMMAQFSSPDQFRSLGGGIYGVFDGQRPLLGEAQTGGRGRVIGGRMEMSNVDLTQQFSDLIIIQRGFQASSQMTSVANEMLQQLLAVGERR